MSESAREGRAGMWFAFALGSAVFAALTAILAKVGIEGVDSNLATAVRTLVVLVMAWAIVLVTGVQGGLASISAKSWIFLVLSGLATGASWLCYYRALQLGQASLVVPIDKLSLVITLVLAVVLLREQLTARGVVGAVLVTVGAIVMVT
jgi:predicted membrane protein|nr:EamA family transporter [Olsenella sp. oral taxon 807]